MSKEVFRLWRLQDENLYNSGAKRVGAATESLPRNEPSAREPEIKHRPKSIMVRLTSISSHLCRITIGSHFYASSTSDASFSNKSHCSPVELIWKTHVTNFPTRHVSLFYESDESERIDNISCRLRHNAGLTSTRNMLPVLAFFVER